MQQFAMDKQSLQNTTILFKFSSETNGTSNAPVSLTSVLTISNLAKPLYLTSFNKTNTNTLAIFMFSHLTPVPCSMRLDF